MPNRWSQVARAPLLDSARRALRPFRVEVDGTTACVTARVSRVWASSDTLSRALSGLAPAGEVVPAVAVASGAPTTDPASRHTPIASEYLRVMITAAPP